MFCFLGMKYQYVTLQSVPGILLIVKNTFDLFIVLQPSLGHDLANLSRLERVLHQHQPKNLPSFQRNFKTNSMEKSEPVHLNVPQQSFQTSHFLEGNQPALKYTQLLAQAPSLLLYYFLNAAFQGLIEVLWEVTTKLVSIGKCITSLVYLALHGLLR